VDHAALAFGDDDGTELLGAREPSLGSQGPFLTIGFDPAPGKFEVLAFERSEDIIDRESVAAEAQGVDPDADLAFPAACEADAADAADSLDARLHALVGEFADRTNRLRACEQYRQDRLRVRVDALDDGHLDVSRQVAHHRRDIVADFLRLQLHFVIEFELDVDDRQRIGRAASQTADAFDGVDRFLENLGDGAFDGFGRGTLEDRGNDDHRKFDTRPQVDSESRNRHESQHSQCADEHHREYGAANRDVGELHLAGSPCVGTTRTRMPGAISRAAAPTMIESRSVTPDNTSARLSSTRPSSTRTGTALPSRTTSTRV